VNEFDGDLFTELEPKRVRIEELQNELVGQTLGAWKSGCAGQQPNPEKLG
jgi:hypothetical protein